MKVMDFQIGDLVSAAGQNVVITSLIPYDDKPFGIALKDRIEFTEEEIQPIPLTAAILEMNGWTSYEYYHVLEKDNYRLKVEIVEDDLFNLQYDVKEGEISGHSFYMCYINDLTLSYVHGLQHALRLVGLSELADNLKI